MPEKAAYFDGTLASGGVMMTEESSCAEPGAAGGGGAGWTTGGGSLGADWQAANAKAMKPSVKSRFMVPLSVRVLRVEAAKRSADPAQRWRPWRWGQFTFLP